MGLFSFGKENATPDEHASSLGTGGAAAAPASSESSVSSATRTAAADNARAQVRKRRGPQASGDGSTPAVTDRELQERINAQIASQLEALHAPELWQTMLCLPADTMHAFTGKERWEISSPERKTMGLSGSALARTMMITNPRALAAFMFISVMSTAYIPRLIGELKDIAAKRKEKEKTPDVAVAKT